MDFSLLFKPKVTFTVGPAPRGIALGDLNQDQQLDIVTANGDGNTVSALIGYGNGSFAPQTTFSVGSNPWGIALGDLNQDTHLDMVVANSGSHTVSVLISDGYGSFAAQTTFSVGSNPWGIALGDLNQDQRLDIVTTNGDDNTVSILIGDGKGRFARQTTFHVGYGPRGLSLVDLNQDQRLDMVVTNFGDETVSVLIGHGNGSFAAQMTFNVGSNPVSIVFGDLNQNQHLDMAVTHYGGMAVSVLIGHGNGSFIPQTTFNVGSSPAGIALGDLNQDQRLDIVTANYGSDTVSVLIGYGNGSFAPQMTFNVGSSPWGIALGDLNQDQLLDIVVTNYNGSGAVSVFLGNPDAYTAHHARTYTQSHTQTQVPYRILPANNHIFYPKGKISFIVTFIPTQDKIDLSIYPNVTYSNLQIRQEGNNALIGFEHQALFQFNVYSSLSQSLTKDDFVFTAASSTRPWLIQTAYLLIAPVNNTDIFNFSSNQNKIDLSTYHINYPAILMQSSGNMASIRFNYIEHSQIIVNHTQASVLNETTFLFAPQPTWSDHFIDLQKAILLPISAIIGVATLISGYAKRGTLKNILYSSHCWIGDHYIKEEVWTPEHVREVRPLTDRHGTPIEMRQIQGIRFFTLDDEESSAQPSCITSNYYARRAQTELLDQELATTQAVSGKASIKLNSAALEGLKSEEIKSETFFIQVIAKNGEILEEFPCNLAYLTEHHQVSSLEITGSHTALESQDESIELDTISGPSQSRTVYSYHTQIQWSNPILQDPRLLQLAYRSAGVVGVDRLIEIGTDSHRYRQFEHFEQGMGTEKAIEWMLGSDAKQVSGSYSALHISPWNLFWVGMIAYRLPAAYDQVQYLLKTTGLDLQEFYEDQGLEPWVDGIGLILRPSLLLGGATLAYGTSSDPLVLLVAANQPGFSSGSDLLSDGIYYLTTILSFARAYASPSAYTLPLVALQGTNLVSHLLVDAGLVAEDNYLMQWMQLATGLASETFGLFLYPDLPIKALQGISLLAQSLHCAELAGEYIAPYFAYAQAEETIEANQTQPTAIEDLVAFS